MADVSCWQYLSIQNFCSYFGQWVFCLLIFFTHRCLFQPKEFLLTFLVRQNWFFQFLFVWKHPHLFLMSNSFYGYSILFSLSLISLLTGLKDFFCEVCCLSNWDPLICDCSSESLLYIPSQRTVFWGRVNWIDSDWWLLIFLFLSCYIFL